MDQSKLSFVLVLGRLFRFLYPEWSKRKQRIKLPFQEKMASYIFARTLPVRSISEKGRNIVVKNKRKEMSTE